MLRFNFMRLLSGFRLLVGFLLRWYSVLLRLLLVEELGIATLGLLFLKFFNLGLSRRFYRLAFFLSFLLSGLVL
jgi:hypothetical protein